ncbi:MAG: hypothetical protein DRR08_16105 [Candidatus Parabeggiatoa sp. nov. 2]|nr:MAG: hypothetical protein B6247_19245 [Beggiatoa sp. 4572_84]RKZ58568.1 MAG: hypothetical protein DRR08_16105 [Gammaproteobacteria bacterium]HEC84461.1 hypothetical protein [Thioploca sp.]
MSDPHNKNRYGEEWPQSRIDACLEELEAIKPFVIVSGGWAWHFMSPEGHVEYKHAHDHKDIDLFVRPDEVATVVSILKSRSFEKVWTKYDKLPSQEDFRRYEKRVEFDDKTSVKLKISPTSVKVTIDFFVSSEVPYREIDGWRVIEPTFLLGLYKSIHSSDNCFAVQAAARLIEQGIDPVGHPELVEIPRIRMKTEN